MLIVRSLILVVMTLVPGLPDPLSSDIKFSDRYIVELGKPYPVIDGSKYYFEAKESVLCLKRDRKRWFVQKLSSLSLSQISRKEYDDMPEDMVVEHIGYFGDRFFMFYSLWDKKNEREQLFYREVDTESGTFIGKGTRLLSVNGKVTGTMMVSGFYRFQVTDKFEMMFSEDEKRMFVQYRKKKDKKERDDEVNEVSMAMFDHELTLEWSGDIRMPYKADDMNVKDYTIDNKGNLCIVTAVYKGNATKKKDREDQDYQYHLLRGEAGGAWEITPLEISGKALKSMTLFEDATGTLRAAGFYSTAISRSTVDGFFVCGFDDRDNIKDVGFHEIPNQLINMYTRAKEVKKNAKEEAKGEDIGFNHMTLRGIVHNDDGDLILIGEKRYITVECVTDSKGRTRCYDVYHADDLLVASIDADGTANWMQRIPKRAASRAPIGSTYKYIHSDDEHHFIRFDKDSNLEINTDEIPGMKGTTIVMVDRLDGNTGEVEREAILNTEEIKGIKLYQLDIDRLVRVGDSELLMEAYKKSKEDVLVRIQVKD